MSDMRAPSWSPVEDTFRSLVHSRPSLASRGARLSPRTCDSPPTLLQPPTGALLEVVPVSMAGRLGDPVGASVTDGAASVRSGHVTTSSRGEMEGLTIEDLRDQVMEGSHDPEGAARELWRRSRRAVTLLICPELRISILQGTLLWPGGEVSSFSAARAGGTFSRSPYKDAWSQLVPQEYGFQKFGPLWKHLVDEYLVHATPSLGSWIIRRGGQ